MIVRLPFPSPELFPNRKNGRAWQATNGAKQKAKDDAYYLTKHAMGAWRPADGPIPLSIVFAPPDARHRDLDNCLAACKSAIDGIALALGVDDRRFRPIAINVGAVSKPGAAIVGVGVMLEVTA